MSTTFLKNFLKNFYSSLTDNYYSLSKCYLNVNIKLIFIFTWLLITVVTTVIYYTWSTNICQHYFQILFTTFMPIKFAALIRK